jgi:prolyl-tRNA editing enzyme YbaK/EbsC (Cys-tRNA(Pro) deacylase)/SAM-dependent methyltransferase
VDWNEGRTQHLKLSEAAAPQYDELYANANFATGSYMEYEIDTLKRWIPDAPDHHLAIDLGCGTGRDSFVLARYFDQVFAYDFSPAMVEVANANKLQRAQGNVSFKARDVEKGLLDLHPHSADFVNSAFGMGSFIENLEAFLREVKRLLKPGGIAVFSFYNRQALVNSLDLEWRPALAARADPDNELLRVEFEETRFDIAARAYTVQDVRNRLASVFDVLELTTFPTLSALFPQQLFVHESARKLCTHVDQLLAANLDVAAGPYIVAVVRRAGKRQKQRPAEGYERVLTMLRRHEIEPVLRRHAPARTMAEVIELLDEDVSIEDMVKSMVVAAPDQDRDERHPKLYLFGVPADRKLDFGKAAKHLGRKRDDVRAATQSEVEDLTKFTVGSVPPFGLPTQVPVILDQRLATKQHVWCGTGHPTESMRISIEDLQILSGFTVADISKPA